MNVRELIAILKEYDDEWVVCGVDDNSGATYPYELKENNVTSSLIQYADVDDNVVEGAAILIGGT